MPYITDTEYSNIQKQLANRAELLEAAKRGLDWMRNEGIGLDDQKMIKQAIAKGAL